LDGLTFNYVGAKETMWLKKAFEESKFFKVVKVLSGDKAQALMVFL
jgi:hypothetical protein